MQKDFHYCAIKVLAFKAGFDADEAQIIAYASQYVDDATEHKKISITGVPEFAEKLYDKKSSRFDPVCTAHQGIQLLGGIKKAAQHKVYIPFHFIPAEAEGYREHNDLRVAPNGPLARQLLFRAFKRHMKSKGKGARSLIKIGIALHSFADTWSHQRFSGRQNSAENDIERIRLFENGEFQKIGSAKQLFWNIIPAIGHAEATNLPDYSHISWKYEHDDSGIDIHRYNTGIFLEAAQTIHGLLCGLSEDGKNVKAWKSFSDPFEACLALDTDKVKHKFKLWSEYFPEVSFDYHKEQWRREALISENGKKVRYDWDDFQDQKDYNRLKYKATGDEKWFHFHVEAARQRAFIMKAVL